jgi:glutamyl-Q tRNA(Asp) synthetase
MPPRPMRPAVRFAPSPNGLLHLGHAFSALTVDAWARRLGARFLLRIEDTDRARSRDEFVDAIFRDLRWLGLVWEEPVLRQSEHAGVYDAAARRLAEMGLLYPCFASRTEIADAAVPGAVDPDGSPLYPGLHRSLPADAIIGRKARGEPFCLRLDMNKALALARRKTDDASITFTERAADGSSRLVSADPARWGDAVIVRKDGSASYHLAVVVDDARQAISHVTRGLDLFQATDINRLLQVLLDLPEPCYHHHELIADPSGRKLAKSKGDRSLAALRAEGETAHSIRSRLGFAALPST